MKTLTINVDEILAQPGPGNGYKVYTWLTYKFDNILIFDSGTMRGRSACVFARNPTNIVVTYDIDLKRQQNKEFPINVIRKHQDVTTISPEEFKNVSIIYLDISHDGIQEEKFLDIIEPHFKGILVMDDINHPKRWKRLQQLFMNLEREHHLLPSSIGSETGTGIVLYGDWTGEVV